MSIISEQNHFATSGSSLHDMVGPISVPSVGPHITHITQGDGDGIGIVDAHGYHRERYHQTDDEISGEEGKQRNTLLHRYVHTINLQWQHGVRMQNLAEFILHHSYQHHATDTFQTSTRTARAGSEEHAGCQYHPGNVRPHSSIVVK